jgi:hypothetical protein
MLGITKHCLNQFLRHSCNSILLQGVRSRHHHCLWQPFALYPFLPFLLAPLYLMVFLQLLQLRQIYFIGQLKPLTFHRLRS